MPEVNEPIKVPDRMVMKDDRISIVVRTKPKPRWYPQWFWDWMVKKVVLDSSVTASVVLERPTDDQDVEE